METVDSLLSGLDHSGVNSGGHEDGAGCITRLTVLELDVAQRVGSHGARYHLHGTGGLW